MIKCAGKADVVVTRAEPGSQPRLPLSRERVLRAAIKIADSSGLESLTMRRLAEEFGAEAMSLYYHVASKQNLLDGIADAVVAEINDVVGTIGVPPREPAGKRRSVSGSCPPGRSCSATPGPPASWRRGPAPAWPCCFTTTACSGSCETAVSPMT